MHIEPQKLIEGEELPEATKVEGFVRAKIREANDPDIGEDEAVRLVKELFNSTVIRDKDVEEWEQRSLLYDLEEAGVVYTRTIQKTHEDGDQSRDWMHHHWILGFHDGGSPA